MTGSDKNKKSLKEKILMAKGIFMFVVVISFIVFHNSIEIWVQTHDNFVINVLPVIIGVLFIYWLAQTRSRQLKELKEKYRKEDAEYKLWKKAYENSKKKPDEMRKKESEPADTTKEEKYENFKKKPGGN